MTPVPIEIVGGGLAGLSLGVALRRSGVPVTLFETGHYPRHRVCGEFITGLDAMTTARLGLAPFLADALHHREVAWFIGGGEQPARLQRLPLPALGLSRHVLDARLADAFIALGGDLRTDTRVTDQGARPGRVFTTGRRAGKSPWMGLKIHAHGLPLIRDLELHLGERTYVGLARIEGGAVNICGLFHRRKISAKGPALLLDYLHAAGLGALAARLASAELDSASLCAVAAVGFDRRVAVGDRIALGDAGAMIPPFTGNGMAMAFQSAATALDPLIAYARGECVWPETCRKIHSGLRRRFRVRLAAAAVLHPFLLQPRRQRLLGPLARAGLLPLRAFYAALH